MSSTPEPTPGKDLEQDVELGNLADTTTLVGGEGVCIVCCPRCMERKIIEKKTAKANRDPTRPSFCSQYLLFVVIALIAVGLVILINSALQIVYLAVFPEQAPFQGQQG